MNQFYNKIPQLVSQIKMPTACSGCWSCRKLSLDKIFNRNSPLV